MNFSAMLSGRKGSYNNPTILRGQQPTFYGQVSWALSSQHCRKWHPRSAGDIGDMIFAAVWKDYSKGFNQKHVNRIGFYRDYIGTFHMNYSKYWLGCDKDPGTWTNQGFASWFMSAKGCVAVVLQNGQPPNGMAPLAEAPSPLHGKLSKDVFTDAPCMEYSPFLS